MKKENPESIEKVADMLDDKQPAEPPKPAKSIKPAKPKKEKKQPSGVRLPFLLEFTYTISTLVLIFLALSVIITSFLGGASLFTTLLRTGVALFVVGSVLMLISSQISSGLLFAARLEEEEAQKKQEEQAKQEAPVHSVFEQEPGRAEA